MTQNKHNIIFNLRHYILALLVIGQMAHAEPKHGISMYGKPALLPDFVSFPYADPDAPKGGKIVFGEKGGFDSLNPYIQKGITPYGVIAHTVETLMIRSYDEPFTLYGLLAETIETGPNREWVEFTLHKEAKFSDGSPVTVEDVLWSFEITGTKGAGRYRNSWKKIEKAEKTGPRSVKFTFNVVDLEAALMLGLRPILRKADWDGREFDQNSLDIITGSGPYIVDKFEPNRFISYKRDPNYWGKDLPFNKGRHNADELRYEYYGDGDVLFEAFKGGNLSWYREGNAGKWDSLYNFPAIKSGDIVKSIIPHKRPSGMKGFVMNTRREKFSDWRVRDALIHAFNFEYINQAVNGGSQSRSSTYFSNSVLGSSQEAATGAVLALLEPFKEDLFPGTIEGYSLPVSQASGRHRKNLKIARDQFKAAGWKITDGVLRNAKGEAFTIDILLKSGGTVAGIKTEGIANLYRDTLEKLGIKVTLTTIDTAQYTTRKKEYDFDMVYNFWWLSLSPGNEQKYYWGSDGVTEPGTRNYMGMNSPAAEAMIDKILSSVSHDESISATKALDRVLISGRYVVPFWYSKVTRLAYKKELHFPERLPMYGDWSGFLPDVWWVK